MQKRYFEARLKKFRQKPELHRALIEDCERYISMLEECGSAGDLMARIKETGNMVSTAKAKALDRPIFTDEQMKVLEGVFKEVQNGWDRKTRNLPRRRKLSRVSTKRRNRGPMWPP